MDINKINKAFWYYSLVAFDKHTFSEKIIEKLTFFLDFNQIPPSAFINNENLLKVAHRSNITSENLISIIYYKPESINYIELDYFNFKNEDIIGLLIAHPLLLEFFNIDFKLFSLMQLVRIYSENINLKDKVDFSKFEPTKEDIKSIFNSYIKKKHVIELLNFEILNTNQIRILLKEYGEEFIEKLDVAMLKQLDWLDVLTKRPELLKYCNVEIFEKEDGYNLVQLVFLFEELECLIEKNKEIIGAMGIEALLLQNPEKYLPIIDIKKLKDKNWLTIIKKHSWLKNKYIYASS